MLVFIFLVDKIVPVFDAYIRVYDVVADDVFC